MLEGLMQHDHPLTLQLVLERMRGMYGDAEVVTLTDDGHDARDATPRSASASTGWPRAAAARRRRRATAWRRSPGTRQHHLEAYLAVPCMGAVLHTLNIRLFPEQLAYIVNHAEDKVIFVDASLVAAARAAAPTSSRPSSTSS